MTIYQIIAMSFCVAFFCYYGSNRIAAGVMRAIAYDYSIATMINYIHAESEKNGKYDSAIGSRGISINLIVRMWLMIVIYTIMLVVSLIIVADFRHDDELMTAGLVALISIATSGLFAIIEEFRYVPQILRYEGLDKEGHNAFFRDLFSDSSEDDDDLMIVGIEDIYTPGLFDRGDLVVLLVPPTGDMIYDRL